MNRRKNRGSYRRISLRILFFWKHSRYMHYGAQCHEKSCHDPHSALKINCFPSFRILKMSCLDFAAAFIAASSSRLILASCPTRWLNELPTPGDVRQSKEPLAGEKTHVESWSIRGGRFILQVSISLFPRLYVECRYESHNGSRKESELNQL